MSSNSTSPIKNSSVEQCNELFEVRFKLRHDPDEKWKDRGRYLATTIEGAIAIGNGHFDLEQVKTTANMATILLDFWEDTEASGYDDPQRRVVIGKTKVYEKRGL